MAKEKQPCIKCDIHRQTMFGSNQCWCPAFANWWKRKNSIQQTNGNAKPKS